MKRYRIIPARSSRSTIPREAAYIAAGHRQSLFWQMIAGLADADDKANAANENQSPASEPAATNNQPATADRK